MTDGTFSFYPVVRRGYRPDSTFSTGRTDVPDPGTARVDLELTATGPEGKATPTPGVDLRLYGPGEVTNLDTDQVVREEPTPATSAFPPNYFPLVEFDSPQLPWLFSPQRADDAGRNRPWLCLVVVPTGSVEYSPPGAGPLPVLETPTDELPDASETWAWAHAQVVGEHDPETVFASASNRTVSRLLCPRNLDPDTEYRACVVPTFEPGRRAGLGLDPTPDGRSSIGLAWTDEDAVRLPVYHSWEFATGRRGDFESLARELRPTRLGGEVGVRTVDVSDPGPDELAVPADADDDVGTVDVGGALTSIGTDPDPYDEALRDRLRDLLNDPGEVVSDTDYGAVGPPLYGRWHAGVSFLEPPAMDREEYYYPTWFNTLNTDPRHRIAAGYGATAVREQQERLMADAWEQFGDLEGINAYLRRVRMASAVLSIRHEQLSAYSTGGLLGLTAPIHGTLLDADLGERTVHALAATTDLPAPLASSTFRRLTRATGPLARRRNVSIDETTLTTHLEAGRVPRVTDGLSTTTAVAADSDADAGSSSGATLGTPSSAGRSVYSGDDFGPEGPPRGGRRSGRRSKERPRTVRDAAETTSGDGLSGSDGERSSDTADDGVQSLPDEPLPSPALGESLDFDSLRRDPDVRRLLTALDGLAVHVDTADEAVSSLSRAIERDDPDAVKDLLETPPTVLERAESVGANTVAPVSRAVSKLLVEPRPAELADGFDRSTANGLLHDLHSAQDDLESAVRAATEALATDEPPERVGKHLDRASDAIGRLREVGRQLRRAATGGRVSVVDPTVEPDATTLGEFDAESLPNADPPAPIDLDLPSKERLRASVLGGLDPSARLSELAAEVTGIDGLLRREDPVEEVLAAPSFPDPTYELLADLDQEYFLPGAGDLPRNGVGLLRTNPAFVEAFMAGLNHEFARELGWRGFPTDKRGTYFRRFWEHRGSPDTVDGDPPADIAPIHTWDEADLGENSPGATHASVVLVVRGELLRRYPNTDIFAAKAVADGGEGADADRVPALPDTHVTRQDAGPDLQFPLFRGRLDPDVVFFGFDLTPEAALYDPYHADDRPAPDDRPDEGWFFVLQEPPAETRFGLDAPDPADVGDTPPGITHDGTTERITEAELRDSGAEHGWDALSWAHLVEDGEDPDDVTYVDVDGSRPGRENWAVEPGSSYVADASDPDYEYDASDAAEWGYNSAHLARATWQLPVRVSIHADDMIPNEPPHESDWRNVQIDTPRPGGRR